MARRRASARKPAGPKKPVVDVAKQEQVNPSVGEGLEDLVDVSMDDLLGEGEPISTVAETPPPVEPEPEPEPTNPSVPDDGLDEILDAGLDIYGQQMNGPKFNPDAPYDEVCGTGTDAKYFQNMHYYDVKGRVVGLQDPPPGTFVEEEDEPQREGLAPSPLSTKDFSGDQGEASDAQRENAKAAAAEERNAG